MESEQLNYILPPQSIEAEQACLGSMMIQLPALYKAREIVAAVDFYRPTHQEIFNVVCNLADREIPIDHVEVQEELRSRGKLDECGGMPYIMALFDAVPTAGNVEYYANIVAEKALRRRTIATATEIMGIAHEQDIETEVMIQRVTESVLKLRKNKGRSQGITLKDAITQAYQSLGERNALGGINPTVKFGIGCIDHNTLGIQPGFTLLAARMSEGKTALMLQALKASMEYGPHLVFSLETMAESLANRLIAARAHLDLYDIRTGKVNATELARAANAANDFYDADNIIIRTDCYDIASIVAETKMAIMEHGITTVWIDYAQMVEAPGQTERDRCNNVSRGLKRLFTQHGIRVVAAAQLNRMPETRRSTRKEKEPEDSQQQKAPKTPKVPDPTVRISDLAETDVLGRDADLAILIDNPNKKGNCWLCIGKQKDGPVGHYKCWYEPSTLTFHEGWEG
jgi:replicative DNA helicase